MDPDFKVSKLKKIDYDKLLDETNQYKKRSEESFNKINSIFQKTKQSKVNSKLIEHKKIWNFESIRLNKQKRKLQREIDNFISSSNFDFIELKDTISEDHIDYRSTVIEPVFLLCEDVKEWCIKKKLGQNVPDSNPIQDLLSNTKNKLDQVSGQLETEIGTISVLLYQVGNQYHRPLSLDNLYERVGTGIPSHLYSLFPTPERSKSLRDSCSDHSDSDEEAGGRIDAEEPDPELIERDKMMSELLSQFIELDGLYQAKLDTLLFNLSHQNQHNNNNNKIYEGKFTESEYEKFKFLHEYYYSNTTVNRHQMFMDAAKIIFPNHSQSSITSLEEFVTRNQCFQEALQALASDWKNERRELTMKIRLTIDEYTEEMATNKQQHEERQKQQNLCAKLTHQVTEWRRMKQEKEMLEAEINQQKLAQEMKQSHTKLEKELQNREKTKQRILKYKQEKLGQEQKLQAAKERRLLELQTELERQSQLDRERIRYRQDLWYERQWEQELVRLDQEQHKKMTEAKLQELADTVKPQVKYDPDRIYQATEAWRHHVSEDHPDDNESSQHPDDSSFHHHPLDDSYTRLNRPLYTYTDKSILSDPRVRVEAALRQAGLIEKDYARKIVLNSVQPPHATRKDNQLSSTNFLKQ